MGKKRVGRCPGFEVSENDNHAAYSYGKALDDVEGKIFKEEVHEFKFNGNMVFKEILGLADSDDDDDDNDNELIAGLEKQNEHCKQYAEHVNTLTGDLGDSDGNEQAKHYLQWGPSRHSFYRTSSSKKHCSEDGDFESSDFLLEELEAKAVQRRQSDLICENDFDVDLIKLTRLSELNTTQNILKDLATFSSHEKWQLLQKESPELLPLIDKYRTVLHEMDSDLVTLHCYCYKPSGTADDIKCLMDEKISLLIDFCISVSFYVALKVSNETSICQHPIFKSIVEYQMLIRQLEAVEYTLKSKFVPYLSEMNELKISTVDDVASPERNCGVPAPDFSSCQTRCSLSVGVSSHETEPIPVTVVCKMNGGVMYSKLKLSHLVSDSDCEPDESIQISRTWTAPSYLEKLPTNVVDNSACEEATLAYHNMLTKGQKSEYSGDENEFEEMSIDDTENEKNCGGVIDLRRRITQQMINNRGMVPRRKKEYKNPRVKHRLKYDKAKIRRRGQIREVHPESRPYSGEIYGIRAAVKRGVHLK